ncbi:MAG: type II toxin-antitoxin system RelE/ParE family toxin [Planctomycetes bacterium]|nr:type II toxin-antitoxin system RelE/ParE family toxin [Planctomycetota bacterium]
MGKSRDTEEEGEPRRPVVWLYGEIKTPPFSAEARQEAGYLLHLLQAGEHLDMPQAEPLPIVGPRCGALRIRDGEHNWRIMYRVDPDAVIITEVYAKKTRKIPQEVIDRCKARLGRYDEIVNKVVTKPAKKPR